MRSTLSLPAGLAAAILLACNTTVHAHTWVEEIRKVASNGSFVGAPGYIRDFTGRPPGVDPNTWNVNLLPPNGRGNAFLSTDLMCKSNQLKGKQTKEYPALTAAPGDQIALRYLENGHVTLYTTNLGKPAGRGTVFVYGTKESLESDTYLGIHRVWNSEGTGGDKRGKLIATRPYDDGRCFQVNNSPLSAERKAKVAPFTDQDGSDLLCQNDIQIPTDAGTSGSYTLYWVWEWPTLDTNGAVATNESYTSCMDISMTSEAVATVGKFAAEKAAGKAANAVGIEAQLSATQFLIDPTALPSLTSDNLPTGTPNGKAVPSTSSKAGIPTTKAPAAGGLVTVTVTASAKEVTVTVTKDPATASTPALSSKIAATTNSFAKVSTVTVSPIASSKVLSSSASAVYNTAFPTFPAVPMSSALASTGIPTPTPFLSPASQVQQGAVDAAAVTGSSSCSS